MGANEEIINWLTCMTWSERVAAVTSHVGQNTPGLMWCLLRSTLMGTKAGFVSLPLWLGQLVIRLNKPAFHSGRLTAWLNLLPWRDS